MSDKPPKRPTKRSECINGPRPCPWVSCRYHLLLDVTSRGRIIFNRDTIEECEHTCALDVAAEFPQGMTLEDVGTFFDISRERVRQIEDEAMDQLYMTLHEDLSDAESEAGESASMDDLLAYLIG